MSRALTSLGRTVRPCSFRAVSTDRSAVTLAIMMAAHGRTVVLEIERHDWLESLSDGNLPFAAPRLLPLLHRALRAERLELAMLTAPLGRPA